MIRILIVDDHAVVRSGLRLLLEREDDLEAIGEAGDGKQAVQMARELKPDIVLLDVVMPGSSGIDAAAEIRIESPDSRILMLSMQDDPTYVRQAFASGAAGYVAQGRRGRGARRGGAEGRRGRPVRPPDARRRLVAEPESSSGPVDSLSDREREVLKLLALGHTNQEIARQLFVSVRTVEAHRAHILNKLRASTRAELVRHAIDTGLLND